MALLQLPGLIIKLNKKIFTIHGDAGDAGKH
jgi:hypothetical protein